MRTNHHVWNTLAHNRHVLCRVIKSACRTESPWKEEGEATGWNQHDHDWVLVKEGHLDRWRSLTDEEP